MFKKLLLLLIACMALTVQVKASDPFRRHRENALSAIPNAEGSIIFIGNSITNMNQWRESFGVPDGVSIINRGISGAISDEVISNLESYIANKPSKIFLMIGTNDLNTAGMIYPEYPLRNLKKIITRIRKETPNTMVYVQSILPSILGGRASTIPLTNPLYEEYVAGLKDDHVVWLNLYPLLSEGGTNNMKNGTSLDAIHPNAAGYAIWTRAIKEQVGYEPVYPDNLTTIANGDASYGGNSGVFGMLISNLNRYPVKSDNIVIVGDEMVENGELHEFLGNAKVLSHGTGWGFGGGGISTIHEGVKASLGTNAYVKEGLKREDPKQIYLYAGTSDMMGNTTVANALTQYKAMVATCKEKAPSSKIFIMTVLNVAANSNQLQKIKEFNAGLATIANEDASVELVDIYSALNSSTDTRNADYFCNPEGGYYVSGLGYARIAEEMAKHIGEGCNPITVEKASATRTLNLARNALGVVISKALDIKFDGTAGSYSKDAETTLNSVLDAAYAELAKGSEATAESLAEKATAINTCLSGLADKIVQPQYSTDSKTVTYSLKSVRLNKALTNNGAGQNVTGSAYSDNVRQMWKFVQRDDKSLDIINMADGSYLSPVANNNTPVQTSATRPSAGWTLKGCAKAGAFIVTSGSAQLNQSNQDNVLNWGSGTNTSDVGCQYIIEEAEIPEANWYRIKYENNAALDNYYAANALTGRYIVNRTIEYKQLLSGTNVSYSLGVTTKAVTPAADDATYFVNIMDSQQDAQKYIKSANGHFLASNATSALSGTAIAFTADGNKYNIGSNFILLPNLDNVWGFTSSSSHASTRYSLEKVDLTKVGLTAWTVTIMNGTSASQIADNTQVSCSNSALKGISKVYDEGTFFFPTGTTPVASDFGVEGYLTENTVNADSKTISVVVGGQAITAEAAQAILDNKGVGYPAEGSASRTALEQAIKGGNANAISEAVEAFKADANVELPKSGKAYYIVNIQADGTKRYFNNTADSLQLVQTTATDNLPESALFVVRQQGDKFVLVNTLGQFLIFKGKDAGINGNKGYLDAYEQSQCDLTVKRFAVTDGNNVSIKAGVTNGDLFGRFFIAGTRVKDDGKSEAGCFVVKADGNFDQASLPFFNDGFSSAVQLVEAADWHNSALCDVVAGDSLLGTLSLPFAVEKGNVRAFAVKVVDTDEGKALQTTELSGNVIPANTPVLLSSKTAEPSLLVPAITAGTAPANNDLVAAPEANVFTLGTFEGAPAFIALSGEVVAGKAYLAFAQQPSVVAFPFAKTSTGIGSIGAAASADGKAVFDLFGRRVSKPTSRGIYVIGSQKVLVK